MAARRAAIAFAVFGAALCDDDLKVCEEWADKAFDLEDRLKECKARIGGKGGGKAGKDLHECQRKVGELSEKLGKAGQERVRELEAEVSELKKRLRHQHTRDDDDDDAYKYGGSKSTKATRPQAGSAATEEAKPDTADTFTDPELEEMERTAAQCTDAQSRSEMIQRIRELKRRLAEKSKQFNDKHPEASWFFGWVGESIKDYFTFARFMGRWFDALPGYFHEKVCCIVGAGFTCVLQFLKHLWGLLFGKAKRSRQARELARLEGTQTYQALPENVRYTVTRTVNAIESAERNAARRSVSEGWVPLITGATVLACVLARVQMIAESIALSSEGLLGLVISFGFGQTFSQYALQGGAYFLLLGFLGFFFSMGFRGLQGLYPPLSSQALLLTERFATLRDLIETRNAAGVERESAQVLSLLDSNAAGVMAPVAPPVPAVAAGKHDSPRISSAPGSASAGSFEEDID
eukprot:TRINITY_DN9223_c0_g2_i1.p1 TRINITY_DN9223_c0_g2~~TRINITY_DN9223_c0_g2_i1.p1  ORF type:complete len:464 (+),score=152.60 TRINITY_DN9223_c0_g2_i1:79-1470(+)